MDPCSRGLLIDKISYLIEINDYEKALFHMNHYLESVIKLCLEFNVDSDWWLNSNAGFLQIADEFTEQFEGLTQLTESYEHWVSAVSDLALIHCPKAYDSFSHSVPTISRKRRRVGK